MSITVRWWSQRKHGHARAFWWYTRLMLSAKVHLAVTKTVWLHRHYSLHWKPAYFKSHPQKCLSKLGFLRSKLQWLLLIGEKEEKTLFVERHRRCMLQRRLIYRLDFQWHQRSKYFVFHVDSEKFLNVDECWERCNQIKDWFAKMSMKDVVFREKMTTLWWSWQQ